MAALEDFVGGMDALMERESAASRRAEGAAGMLGRLLTDPANVPEQFRIPSHERYAQHIVHVHPAGAYSLVSLVWLPGQETPIHNHRCWCVVGVLEGVEFETDYDLRRDGVAVTLVEGDTHNNRRGDVSVLVPPKGNIHRVTNGGQSVAISLHVYGADISALGSSINRIFDDHSVITAALADPPRR